MKSKTEAIGYEIQNKRILFADALMMLHSECTEQWELRTCNVLFSLLYSVWLIVWSFFCLMSKHRPIRKVQKWRDVVKTSHYFSLLIILEHVFAWLGIQCEVGKVGVYMRSFSVFTFWISAQVGYWSESNLFFFFWHVRVLSIVVGKWP